MVPKFQIFLDASLHYRWRLVAGNGQIVATSGEAFASRYNAIRSAKLVKQIACNTYIEE